MSDRRDELMKALSVGAATLAEGLAVTARTIHQAAEALESVAESLDPETPSAPATPTMPPVPAAGPDGPMPMPGMHEWTFPHP